MNRTMRAAVLAEPGRFELREIPLPEPDSHEVLVRVARTGICGTDLHIFKGNYARDKLPMVPGHEFTGHVAGMGREAVSLAEGQPVVVDMNIGCTRCYWCRRNEVLNCPDAQQIGITMDGAFAEYIAVPARLVIPAPEGMSAGVLALTEPLACVVRAVRKARISFARSAVVLGVGPIGNLHVQLLRVIGAAPIIAADLSPERANMALEVGADFAVGEPANLKETVLSATDGRGADFVIESVGLPQLYQSSIELVRAGGHIGAFGLASPGETLSINILDTILQENSLKGSVGGMGEDMHDALTLLAYGRIDTRFFTRAEYPLEDIQTAFDSIESRPQDLKTQIAV